MGWSAQYFTTIIIEGNTPLTGIFIYNGTPSLGTLIGSWTAASGTDAFGNAYPAGINVSQGQLQGVSVNGSQVTASTILNSILNSNVLSQCTFNGGTIRETTIVFDSGGGQLFGYTSTVTTVTETVAGTYTWDCPVNGTASVSCIAAGAGGDGGNTSEGGNGGGGGEFASEPHYAVTAKTYSYTVGAGGAASTTGGGHGADGTDSFFDATGVYANGGGGNGTGGTGSANSVHFDGGAGGASNGDSGGASGGNSGNSLAAGNAGVSPAGATGGPSPAAQAGSGTGGAGGNDLGNGAAGGSPGAGGGGAGAGGSGTTTLTKTYYPTYTASYYGPDATGGNANGLRSTSTLYQGGETASGGSYNGNQRCVMVYNSDQIAADFAGYTPTGLSLELLNQHTWYSGGMNVEFDTGQDTSYPGSPPDTWQGSQYYVGTGTIGEGEAHSYQLGATVAGYFTGHHTNFLGLGAYVAADYPYNLNYYGYMAGGTAANPITITGTKGTGTVTSSGKGADGSVVITYASSSAMIFALSAAAGTDTAGNSYAAGYTGPVTAFEPGVSPAVPETWHDMALSNGWHVGSGGFAQYKMLPDNQVAVRLNNVIPGTINDGTLLWAWPSSDYTPVAEEKLSLIAQYSSAPAYGSMPFLYCNGGSGIEVYDLRGTVASIHAKAEYSLD